MKKVVFFLALAFPLSALACIMSDKEEIIWMIIYIVTKYIFAFTVFLLFVTTVILQKDKYKNNSRIRKYHTAFIWVFVLNFLVLAVAYVQNHSLCSSVDV